MPAFAEFDTSKYVYQSSDLSRHSKLVFAAAEEHPVSVSRRDGADLVLMTKAEASAREHLLGFAAQFIITKPNGPRSVVDQLTAIYPWMTALTPESREKCARDLLDAASGAISTGKIRLFDIEVDAWQETATAIAAGLVPQELDWLEVPVRVERP